MNSEELCGLKIKYHDGTFHAFLPQVFLFNMVTVFLYSLLKKLLPLATLLGNQILFCCSSLFIALSLQMSLTLVLA